MLAIANNNSHGNAYNVAGDDVISQVEFIELCGKVGNCEPKLHFVNDPTYNNLIIGMPWLTYDLVADTSQIKRDLGLAFTPLETAIGELWAWLRHHPNHPGTGWVRGERLVLKNRPIPIWVKIYWKLVDTIKFSKLSILLSWLKRIFRNI